MKKIYINGPYDVEIRDVPIPTPGPGEVLIKTQYTGISSGTEMMLYCGTFPNFKLKKWPQWTDYPVCPGYELVGTVVAIGEEAAVDGDMSQLDSLQPKSDVLITKASDFKVGDRVISMGEHAEYACLPAEFITKIPDHVSSEEATLAVLGNTAMQAIRRGAIEFGDTVAVIGAGILGYLVAVEAKLAGAGRVIVIEDANAETLKGVISRCRFFIGARTHATIAAYSTCVPTLVVGYSVKAKGIAKDLFGTYENYVMPVQSLANGDELNGAFDWLMAQEDAIRSHLQTIMSDYIRRAYAAADEVKKIHG